MTDLPPAALSIDCDSAATHLLGYGITAAKGDRVLEIGVERMLEALSIRGLRATFFVVAEDTTSRPSWIEAIVAGGHEIASHSASHPVGISRLPADELRREVEEARATIEQATGAGVTGFRAPNWDVSPRLLGFVRRAGYTYDASLLPTPLLIPARILLAVKSRSPSTMLKMPFWPSSLRRLPHVVQTGHGAITEVPVSVAPRMMWPVYHSLRHGMSDGRFAAFLDGFSGRGEPLSYPLHAIDAVGIAEDGIDPYLRRHPGGGVGRAEKLALLERTIDSIAARFVPGTLGDLVAGMATARHEA